jgi:hypothetical protein
MRTDLLNRNLFVFATGMLIFVFSGCRKTMSGGKPINADRVGFLPLDSALIPPPSPVNTAITAYFEEMIMDPSYETGSTINVMPPTSPYGMGLTASGEYFILNTSSLDAFNTRFMGVENDPAYLTTNVIVPITPSIRNYVGIHRLLLNYSQGSTTPPSVYDPTANYFGSLLPSPIVDSVGKRWFLQSYGAAFSVVTRESPNSQFSPLPVPIPPALVSSAPDTIDSWLYNYTTNTWQKMGTAYKSGNNYLKTFYQAGLWNMGTAIPGKYLTLHLRADDSATITNTRVVLTGNNITVAEGMTDADGNMVCFVPAGWRLTANLYQTPVYSNQLVYSTQLLTLNLYDISTVAVNRNANNYLSTVNGIVYDCNGSLLPEGILTLAFNTEFPGVIDYYIPIRNGRFSTSFWAQGSFFNAQITDMAGNPLGDPTMFTTTLNHQDYTYTFSICPHSTLLYANTSIDGQSAYGELDDAAASPVLTADLVNGYSTKINAIKNGKGFQLIGQLDSYLLNNQQIVADSVLVNGVRYAVDASQLELVDTYRYDTNVNGIIEGVVSLYYLDGSNVSHHLLGTFKVRKNF